MLVCMSWIRTNELVSGQYLCILVESPETNLRMYGNFVITPTTV
jgi:hypothetical protein